MVKKKLRHLGKLTVRWVMSRNVLQLYCGGRYIAGVAGNTMEEVAKEFDGLYLTPDNCVLYDEYGTSYNLQTLLDSGD